MWAHVVGVRDLAEDSLKLYLNGDLIGSLKDGTDLDIASGDLPVLIGLNHTKAQPLDGMLDDLSFYNYAMSADEVKAMFESTGIVKPELVAYYPFDNGKGWKADDVVGNHDGLLMNITSPADVWTDGWVDGAIDFSMAPDTGYVEVADNDAVEFDSTESFTISFLLKADPVTNSNEQQIILKGAFGVDATKGWAGKWYGMQFKGGELRLAVDDNVTKTQLGVNITDIYPANNWAHIVGVRDVNEDSLKLYLNGALIGSMADGTDLNIDSGDLPVLIGLNMNLQQPLDGILDDLKIFNYALSADKIMDMYTAYNITDIPADGVESLPVEYTLKQNYPNPFNPTTNIEFRLAKAGKTELAIYNALGQKVKTLISQEMTAGVHKVTVRADNLSSGVYFYKIKSGDFVQIKKMVLLK